MKKITLLVLLFTTLQMTGQNNSLHFDGQDDYVSLENNFNFENTDTFTIEAWILSNATGSIQQVISKLDSEFRGWGLQLMSNGRLSAYTFSTYSGDVNQRFVIGTASLNDSKWYHVAMSFDGDVIQLYVDGVLEPLTTNNPQGNPLGPIANTAQTQIGSYNANGSQGEFFNGNIDELRIWNVVRSETEIFENHLTELSGLEPNLIGYYKMDVPDSSCDVQDCNTNETHGSRFGSSGVNDLPQFSTETPLNVVDVDCGETLDCDVVGLNDFKMLDVVLSPNPTKDYIQITGTNDDDITYTLFDALGKTIVYNVDYQNNIDVSSLLNGVYFIKISTKNSNVVKRIIKR